MQSTKREARINQRLLITFFMVLVYWLDESSKSYVTDLVKNPGTPPAPKGEGSAQRPNSAQLNYLLHQSLNKLYQKIKALNIQGLVYK